MTAKLSAICAVFILLVVSPWSLAAADKPLKVFILVGQSNMEGHAQIHTFPAIEKDPKTAALYKDMVDAEGKPVVCDQVWIADSFGDFSGNPIGKKSGKLTAGFGSQHHIGTGKIGPEFTFGIYMHKMLGEPILLIKAAWGGKSLLVDFRPPSGGPLPETTKEELKAKAGKYYALVIDHVKEVLADPKSVYPDYDAKAGYELAGFVWFQGFNDMVGPYPKADTADKKSAKDFTEYSRLLSCLIRDVRKDLSAPNLPFVIGVMGVGGDAPGDNGEAFRKAMAAPAETDEFKGTVANVFTAQYWPAELDAVREKAAPFQSEKKKKEAEFKELDREARKKASEQLEAEIREKMKAVLSEDELFLLDNGFSNQGFHYYGSAKFFGQIGKAFAEAMVGLR